MASIGLICRGNALAAFAILSTAALAQTQQVGGSVSGTVIGEDGTAIIGATVAIHLTPAKVSRLSPQRTDWSVQTVTGGVFDVAGLPEGTYTVCPRMPNSTWLNPCEWNFPTPVATVTRSNPNPTLAITLKRGVAVPVRIDDQGQLLAQNEGKTPGAGLLLSVSGPGLFFRLVPLVSKDATGRNYQLLIPFNTQLTLVVHPSFYHLSNANGAALPQGASTKIPLLIPAGQQAAPIRFTIASTGR